MDEAKTQFAALDTDAIDAFEGLREEMSLMVAAVRGLTAAKEKTPDYEPTLREIVRFLDDIDRRLSSMEAKPAMKLTPAVMADEFGKRAVEVRAEDRQAINSAREALTRSLGHVEGLMKKSRSTAEQQWWVTWSATGGALVAIFVTLIGVQLTR
jgi:hypothetical protein